MKRFLTLMVALISISFLFSQVAMADSVLAFETASYDVLVGNIVKPKVVAQGIDGKLTYNWESSDEGVATVKAGTVKGLSGGSATITCTATLKSGEVFKASCTIDVNIPVRSIMVVDKNVEIAPAPLGSRSSTEGDYNYLFRPTVFIEPDNASIKDIEWSSSKTYIATVTEEGIVIGGWNAGVTTITGKAMDGSGKSVTYKVTVPKCFVTADSITITEESGATLGYSYTPVNGISVYGTREKGNCFTTESLDDENGMDMLRILPVKVGSGSISFYRNGSTLKTVKIKVEKSAIRDKDSYPKADILDVVASKDAFIGKHVQFWGTVFKCDELAKNSFVYPEVIDSDEGRYSGIAYAYIDGETRQYLAFEYVMATNLKLDTEYTVFGTIDHFITYTNDTGLSYDVPYLTNVTIGK